MNIEDYREYCLSVKGATECMPFDEHTLVFKVMDKMFTFATLRPKNGRFWAYRRYFRFCARLTGAHSSRGGSEQREDRHQRKSVHPRYFQEATASCFRRETYYA